MGYLDYKTSKRIDELIKRSKVLNSFESERKKEVREKLEEFKISVVQEDRYWVKDRKLKYLKSKKAELEAKASKLSLAVERVGKKCQWMGESIFEDLQLVFEELKRVDMTIYSWEHVSYDNPNKITMNDIARAKEFPCTDFIGVDKEKHLGKSWAKCPFHNEKTASFCLYEDGNRFHCYGCKESGDVIDLVKKIYKHDFIKAVKFILKK